MESADEYHSRFPRLVENKVIAVSETAQFGAEMIDNFTRIRLFR